MKNVKFFILLTLFLVISILGLFLWQNTEVLLKAQIEFNVFLPYKIKKLKNFFNKTDDLTRVGLLRQWVYENTDWAKDDDSWLAKTTYNMDTHSTYNYYQKNQGGAKCNNISYFFEKILSLYGYKNYIYHYGKLSEFNHVVNLVEIEYKNKRVLTIQDATYDVFFLTKNYEPIDFYDLLYKIKRAKNNEFIIKKGFAQSRDILLNKKVVSKDKSPHVKELVSNISSIVYPRIVSSDENGTIMKEINYIINKN